MKNKLYVASNEQKLLFQYLQVQLSDGFWEGEDTDKRLWDCEVIVSENVGLNFQAEHLNTLNIDDILDDGGVNDLMLHAVQMDNADYDLEKLGEDLSALNSIIRMRRIL